MSARLPDGRTVSPPGFTIPLAQYPTIVARSPDGASLAVLSQGDGTIQLVKRGGRSVTYLDVAPASGMTWTTDGLFVAHGYLNTVDRYDVADAQGKAYAVPLKSASYKIGGKQLVTSIVEDPATHLLYAARTADREVVAFDIAANAEKWRRSAPGQPFGLALAPGGTLFATLYDGTSVIAWRADGTSALVPTGAHPTGIVSGAGHVYVANADGHDVAEIDPATLQVVRRFDLSLTPDQAPGQTPSGMTLDEKGQRLFVCESGFNDVAVVDLGRGRVVGRIPTAWYPTSLVYVAQSPPRIPDSIWVASAKGFGSQPNPAGEWDGIYSGLLQNVAFTDAELVQWTSDVKRMDRLAPTPSAAAPKLPPIEHVVYIVKENKEFDEELGDLPHVNGDLRLVLYGRRYTPNFHALAERYTIFDNLMTDGEASIFGHAWTSQAITNDYHERNIRLRENREDDAIALPDSVWPWPQGRTDYTEADMDFDWYQNLADLPKQPRLNVSGVFAPRGELIDECLRRGVSFRVYGEQMTMRPDGTIVPGLAAHADREYPGAHIDFTVRDTFRAELFLKDVAAHGLAAYSYLTLPTDHTAGTAPGALTPASYVSDNDAALAQIIAGLSHRPEWKSTLVIVSFDDAQGTGDHVDSHRLPAIAVGPYVRRGFVSHTRYDQTSIARTVEVLLGLHPLSIYDAQATPMLDALGLQPNTQTYVPLPQNVKIETNSGKGKDVDMELDGPNSFAIPGQEWASIKGAASLAAHERYVRTLGFSPVGAADDAETRALPQ